CFRCPLGFSGESCELPSPLPLSLSRPQEQESQMVIIFAAVLLALFILVFMMVRGCFCDCFGPLGRTRSSSVNDKPLDPEDVNKCLQRYRAYEAQQEMRAHEQQRPLIATISDSCPAPYNTTVLPSAPPIPNPSYRPPSPPPSYSSIAGSTDRIPTSQSQL
ncbi:unnamed protein product, partial [Cylicocyclus nassatus]